MSRAELYAKMCSKNAMARRPPQSAILDYANYYSIIIVIYRHRSHYHPSLISILLVVITGYNRSIFLQE